MRIEIAGHKSDPSTAWERLGDTDFMNRRADGGGVTYELVPTEGGAPRVRGVMAGPAGLSMGFEETYNGWVRERWFRQERAYEGGPLAHSRFLLSFEADGDGVVPHILLDLEPRVRLLAPMLSLRGRTIQSRWRPVLDALPKPGERRGAEARTLSGPLRAALDRWRPGTPERLAEAMEEALRSEREQELRSMRAYGLADRLGLDRREVLAAMLRAAPEGLLEVYWSVRCTRCQGELGAAASLSNLADHADCVSCGIQVVTDLGRSVEVLFAPHPSVFPRSEGRFCTLFPSGAPSLVWPPFPSSPAPRHGRRWRWRPASTSPSGWGKGGMTSTCGCPKAVATPSSGARRWPLRWRWRRGSWWWRPTTPPTPGSAWFCGTPMPIVTW